MEFGINKLNNEMNFCLMTTVNYLTKALVMYDTLETVLNKDFHLYYFAFDEETAKILQKLNYPRITVIKLRELEDRYPELLSVKSERSKAEYFFTCSPLIIEFLLDKFSLKTVIYVDADLYFYKSPEIIIEEMNNHSVLITEHGYYPPLKKMPKGKYCVQFIPFKNDDSGNEVLNDWKRKCLDWCYMREEDGKWADQGYLNEWIDLFPDSVIVMKNKGAGIASWNLEGYEFYKETAELKAFSKEIKKRVDVIFFHFHGVKIYKNGLISAGISKSKKNVYRLVYKNYIKKLNDKEKEILAMGGASRKMLKYDKWSDNSFIFFLKIMRRILLPKKNDMVFFFKIKNNYIWLP